MLDIRLGDPQVHDLLTIYPLLASGDPELPCALLGDAIGAGTLRIGEVGQGSVPSLLAHNSGDQDVLILDGEQLIGSKQNRMTNRSILLGAHSTVEIPVSCMEHGRWHFSSDRMAPTAHHSPAKMRRKVREVEAMRAAAGVAPSPAALSAAQGEVWDSIADSEARLGSHSPTGAMNQVYQSQLPRLEELAGSFPCGDGQVGLLAFVGGAPIGMDVVGGRTLYARLHARLLRGYLMDALERATYRGQPPVDTPAVPAAQGYLDAVRAARRVVAPTVGKGRYAVLTGAVIGGELLEGEIVAHLSAFPAEERSAGPDPVDGPCDAPLPRPSERRRRWPRL